MYASAPRRALRNFSTLSGAASAVYRSGAAVPINETEPPHWCSGAARTFIEQRQVHIDEREGLEIVTSFDELGHGAQQPCVGARFPNRTTEGDNLQQTISLRAAAEPAAKPARTSTASHLQACRLALRCHGRWGVYVVRFSWEGLRINL